MESQKHLCASHRMTLADPWDRQNHFAPRAEWLWRAPGIAKTPLRLAQSGSGGPLEPPLAQVAISLGVTFGDPIDPRCYQFWRLH